MTYTTNYNLKKPDTTDLVKVSDLNDNADAIDAALAGKQDKIFEQVLELEVDWVAAAIGSNIFGNGTEVLLLGDQITSGGLLYNAVVVGLDVKINGTWANIFSAAYLNDADFILINKPCTMIDAGDTYTLLGHTARVPESYLEDATDIRIHYINTNGEEVVT